MKAMPWFEGHLDTKVAAMKNDTLKKLKGGASGMVPSGIRC
ncbi:hypothetical protein [[Clostridium] scindens]|nr:hypothetical protein [[Clostridium] scindens]